MLSGARALVLFSFEFVLLPARIRPLSVALSLCRSNRRRVALSLYRIEESLYTAQKSRIKLWPSAECPSSVPIQCAHPAYALSPVSILALLVCCWTSLEQRRRSAGETQRTQTFEHIRVYVCVAVAVDSVRPQHSKELVSQCVCSFFALS